MAKKTTKRRQGQREIMLEYSKRITNDMRGLLWVISVGGLLLAFYCVRRGFEGGLPWITAMVGLPWTAWGTAAAFYLNLAKSDHKAGGITYDAAKADNFGVRPDPDADALAGSEESPAI